MPSLRTKLLPAGQMQLSRKVLGLAAVVVVLGIALLALLHQRLPSVSALFRRQEAEPVRKVEVPEALKEKPVPYAPPPQPKPPIPVAQPVAPPVALMGVGPPPSPVVPPPSPPPAAAPTPDFLKLYEDQQAAIQKIADNQSRPPASAGAAPKEPPRGRTPWLITPTDITLKRPEGHGTKEGKDKREELGRQGEAAQLVKPAVWARPAYPLKTLYRSQSLPGRLLDAVNSDIPGQMRIELTTPIFDKFAQDYEILPKGTLVVAMQEGKPSYGASRLNLKLEQLELPTGEVISLKAAVGDSAGASGVSAKVNNHLVKLFVATGISALLNIGVQSAAGTPGAGQFFENPGQQAAGDIGRAVQRDTQSIVDRELRIPPTLTIAAGTACTLNLQENIQFNRQPLVVR